MRKKKRVYVSCGPKKYPTRAGGRLNLIGTLRTTRIDMADKYLSQSARVFLEQVSPKHHDSPQSQSNSSRAIGGINNNTVWQTAIGQVYCSPRRRCSHYAGNRDGDMHSRSLTAALYHCIGPMRSCIPPQGTFCRLRGFRACRALSSRDTWHLQRGVGMPAEFWRGGTSNGLMLNHQDLHEMALTKSWHGPISDAEITQLQPLVATLMGSPDPFGRQLNGMGGGISSLSKACIVSRSERPDADIDYTFVQIGIKDGLLDVTGNCGNMTSAVGPFAVNQGFVKDLGSKIRIQSDLSHTSRHHVALRLWNSNTSKVILSEFPVSRVSTTEWVFDPTGSYSLAGVPGTASQIVLSFMSPGGAKTGKILPTGSPVDELKIQGLPPIKASLIDVSNPGVFVLGEDVGWRANATPDSLNANTDLMQRLELYRQKGAEMMGLDPTVASIPKIVLIYPPLPGEPLDVRCQALSMQQAHKAVPLTLALNLGTACNIPGTLPHQLVRQPGRSNVVIGHPAGAVEVGASVKGGVVESARVHRTTRWLMQGIVNYADNPLLTGQRPPRVRSRFPGTRVSELTT